MITKHIRKVTTIYKQKKNGYPNKKGMTILKFLNKKIKLFILLSISIIVLIYVSNITSIPNKIVLFEGENLNIKTEHLPPTNLPQKL